MHGKIIVCAGVLVISVAPLDAFATDVKYTCANGSRLMVHFSPPNDPSGKARLVFAGSGKTYTLPLAVSADGSRYAGAGTEFWIKGRSATLTRGSSAIICQAD
ncbi:MliC family protein [Rhizobium sp. Root1220]|uniref:MliC family protein n=1 Tax=Rhizobium sp. Root1220 TaxID=1736432 RepID=UPI000B1B848A|nr:MliC family protein [Rhizobium sp. Root1220]